MNPDVKDFYQFKVEDFELKNYKHGPKVENIPIAI
jgi:thymidylate synthase